MERENGSLYVEEETCWQPLQSSRWECGRLLPTKSKPPNCYKSELYAAPACGWASSACCSPSNFIKCATLLLRAPPPPLLLLALASLGGFVVHKWSSGLKAPGPTSLPVPVGWLPTTSLSMERVMAQLLPVMTRLEEPNTATGEWGCDVGEKCGDVT